MKTRAVVIRGVPVPWWVLVMAFVQIGISLVALGVDPVPTRLGFHMYAGTGGPHVTAIDASGEAVDIDGLHPHIRQDLPTSTTCLSSSVNAPMTPSK